MSVVPDKLAALAAPLGTRGALADVLAGICSALGADIELVDTVNDEATCPTTSLVTNAQATQAAKRLGLDQLGDAQAPIVMVLVDGLGWQMLRERAGHTPNLRRLLADSDYLHTCAPSTTAAALTTLATGVYPGAHAMVGYAVRDPLLRGHLGAGHVPGPGDVFDLITFKNSSHDPLTWQSVPTLIERANAKANAGCGPQLGAVSIGRSKFAGSGLSLAAWRGFKHIGVDALDQRPYQAYRAIKEGAKLVYLYVGELDHAGHNHGWHSDKWLEALEALDAMVGQLFRRLPAGTRIVLTADHGMVDTDRHHRIDLAKEKELAKDVVAVAGESRFLQLYVPDDVASAPAAGSPGLGVAGARGDGGVVENSGREELAQSVAKRWAEFLGDRAIWVGTDPAPLMGALSPGARAAVGDVLVALNDNWTVVDSRVQSFHATQLIGVHGSLTPVELEVPLIKAVV
jgi:type I phosphodiesterase/nucleotide pyrophosphatase